MNHVLDNPAWNALISGNQSLSNGDARAKYFSKNVSPFAGLIESSPENFSILHELLPFDGPVGLMAGEPQDIPTSWEILQYIRVLQMIYNARQLPESPTLRLTPLTEEHVPAMLALTKLTNPGPFATHTIDFGYYYGIFNENRLVAMAGQRLHPFNYAEISAVCTHPDFAGHGYAGQLLRHQVRRIITASDIPFLHVRHDNDAAISVYRRAGFSTRKEIHIYILQKNQKK